MHVDLRCDCGCTPRDAYKFGATLDGVDVTNECFMANDVLGMVGLYRRDETGHFYKDWVAGGAASEILHGRVEIWAVPS